MFYLGKGVVMLKEKSGSFQGLSERVGKALSFLSPNSWTVISFAVAFVAAFFLAQGALVPGVLSLVAFAALDGVDGAVARVTNRKTKFGALLDHSVDKLGEGIVLLSLGFAALPFAGFNPFVIAGVAAWSSILVSTIDAKGGEVWGSRVSRKLYGRAERMILLAVLLVGSMQLGSAFLSPSLVVFSLASLLTCAQLLVEYAGRKD
jgi:phosphatidylglycerophosphate synthase